MSKTNSKAVRAGAINRGVSHGIRKIKVGTSKKGVAASAKTKTKRKANSGQRFSSQLFSVQASVARDTCDAPQLATESKRRFFRSRGAGRRSVVTLVNAQPKCKSSVSRAAVTADATSPALSPALRRSPRKLPAHSLPVHCRPQVPPPALSQPSGDSGGSTAASPLRRSPRKSIGRLNLDLTAVRPLGSTGTPTRLILSPRRALYSAGRSAVADQPQPPAAAAAAAQQSVSAEEVLVMETEEDKENESPAHSPKTGKPTACPTKFYSIFYRKERKDGLSPSSPSPTVSSSDSGVFCKHNTRHARRSARTGCPSSSASASPGCSLQQLTIDAGQRRQGVSVCGECGLVTSDGDEHDASVHAAHHARLASVLKFPGWKKERVVADHVDARVVLVLPSDAAYAWKKIDSVLAVIDAELGFSGVGIRDKCDTKVALYVCEAEIRGCLVAERVQWAHQVVTGVSGDDGGEGSAGSGDSRQPMACDVTRRPCVCGVSRVWVQRQWRRRGIAAKLVDAIRCHFSVTPLGWDQVAFSDPTPDGARFAEAVTGRQNYLVYSH